MIGKGCAGPQGQSVYLLPNKHVLLSAALHSSGFAAQHVSGFAAVRGRSRNAGRRRIVKS